MNREIKFRGRRVDKNEWVYGYLVFSSDKAWIGADYHDTYYQVDPATVGQFAGLKDENKIEIYEGDVLELTYHRDRFGKHTDTFRKVVEWEHSTNYSGWSWSKRMEYKIIGNIYDNPELLKTIR